MSKEVTSEKESGENRSIEETTLAGTYQSYGEEFCRLLSEVLHSQPEAGNVLATAFHKLTHFHQMAKYIEQKRWGSIQEWLQELNRRVLNHTSTLEKLEADVDVLKEKKVALGTESEWPSYASEDFEKIVKNTLGLENAGDDKSQILYHIMEMETLFGRVEEKARVTNTKYEARLAASLRDICRVHEPNTISEKQIKCFTACTRALIEGWGKLNREKVRWIRSRLLEVGLTWLPVTEKAQKDIAEAKSLLE